MSTDWSVRESGVGNGRTLVHVGTERQQGKETDIQIDSTSRRKTEVAGLIDFTVKNKGNVNKYVTHFSGLCFLGRSGSTSEHQQQSDREAAVFLTSSE